MISLHGSALAFMGFLGYIDMIPHLLDAQGFSSYFFEKVNSRRLKWKEKQASI